MSFLLYPTPDATWSTFTCHTWHLYMPHRSKRESIMMSEDASIWSSFFYFSIQFHMLSHMDKETGTPMNSISGSTSFLSVLISQGSAIGLGHCRDGRFVGLILQSGDLDWRQWNRQPSIYADRPRFIRFSNLFFSASCHKLMTYVWSIINVFCNCWQKHMTFSL